MKMAKKPEIKQETVQTPVDRYSKAQILASNRYANRKDALAVILDDKKVYSSDEVDDLLNKFMKGKVK